MQIDKISFNDISIFHQEEEYSIFHKLNFTRTVGGKEWLRRFFSDPHRDLKRIIGTQNIIKTLLAHIDDWPKEITNGTVIMVEKFLEYDLDPLPRNASSVNSLAYRVLHNSDYEMLKYSVKHFADFYRGLKKLLYLFSDTELPHHLRFYLDRIVDLVREKPLQELANSNPEIPFTTKQNVYFAHQLRMHYRTGTRELVEIYSRLEAWFSMAMAVKTFDLQFPQFMETDQPFLDCKGLYHIMLSKPVAYDVHLSQEQNFMFLTGANMAGKSTLIKAVGSSVFLAHLGMGVPAVSMRLSMFDGLLSNINVADNIVRGESYFFNEVQRIKTTIQKINDGKKWLVLIDELFKGTNVQDAMKCSMTVIKGLIKIPNSLFILSTHLYEISDDLRPYPNIQFRYFETKVKDDQLEFSYELKEGVSNDRIGYVILRREKVVEMLENL